MVEVAMLNHEASRQDERSSRARTLLTLFGALSVTASLAVMSSLAQSLLWFKAVQWPLQWAAEAVEPWLPPMFAVQPESIVDKLHYRSWSAQYDLCTYEYDVVCQARDYWLAQAGITVLVVLMYSGWILPFGARCTRRALWRSMTIAALCVAAIPVVGQAAWTFALIVSDTVLSARAVFDPVDGCMSVIDPPLPATGPTARAGIIAGCVLAQAWITLAVARGQCRAAIADSVQVRGLCPACAYPLTGAAGARCPECGDVHVSRVEAARWAKPARYALLVLIALLLLSPFVLGCIGAAWPHAAQRWIPY